MGIVYGDFLYGPFSPYRPLETFGKNLVFFNLLVNPRSGELYENSLRLFIDVDFEDSNEDDGDLKDEPRVCKRSLHFGGSPAGTRRACRLSFSVVNRRDPEGSNADDMSGLALHGKMRCRLNIFPFRLHRLLSYHLQVVLSFVANR